MPGRLGGRDVNFDDFVTDWRALAAAAARGGVDCARVHGEARPVGAVGRVLPAARQTVSVCEGRCPDPRVVSRWRVVHRVRGSCRGMSVGCRSVARGAGGQARSLSRRHLRGPGRGAISVVRSGANRAVLSGWLACRGCVGGWVCWWIVCRWLSTGRRARNQNCRWGGVLWFEGPEASGVRRAG
jgi:hypothetical protein